MAARTVPAFRPLPAPWGRLVRVADSPFSDCRFKTREDFDSLLGLEVKEDRVIPVPNLAEETLEPPPAAISLGTSLDGKS